MDRAIPNGQVELGSTLGPSLREESLASTSRSAFPRRESSPSGPGRSYGHDRAALHCYPITSGNATLAIDSNVAILDVDVTDGAIRGWSSRSTRGERDVAIDRINQGAVADDDHGLVLELLPNESQS